MLILSHSRLSHWEPCVRWLFMCACISRCKSSSVGFKQDLKCQIFASEKSTTKKTNNAPLAGTCQTPRYRGRPSNLPLSTALASELPSRRNGSTKMEKRPMHKASACISHDSFMSNLPRLHVPCSPLWRSLIMPSHGERVRARLMYLCCTAASWNRHGVRCIISWFFYAQNTSSELTSTQLLHLISPELI